MKKMWKQSWNIFWGEDLKKIAAFMQLKTTSKFRT